jgi:hypothetical protein
MQPRAGDKDHVLASHVLSHLANIKEIYSRRASHSRKGNVRIIGNFCEGEMSSNTGEAQTNGLELNRKQVIVS